MLLTIQAIAQDAPNYHEVGNILQESCGLLEERPDISVLFVKKQANKVAHLLVRVSCEADCFKIPLGVGEHCIGCLDDLIYTSPFKIK